MLPLISGDSLAGRRELVKWAGARAGLGKVLFLGSGVTKGNLMRCQGEGGSDGRGLRWQQCQNQARPDSGMEGWVVVVVVVCAGQEA